VLSENLLSNERTLKNITTGEVDLRNLQLTAKLVSSPLSNTINIPNNKNNTKNINLIDRFQSNSDLRNQELDQE